MTDVEKQTDATEYLIQFWSTHASVFMRWFLSLPYKGQLSLLTNACPDLPMTPDILEHELSPCQLLTPELTVTNLLSDNGKSLLRLMNARARKREECARHDLIYIQSLRREGKMPIFSGNSLNEYKLAFVDPKDPEMRIQALDHEATDAMVESMQKKFDAGHLIEADVWLTLQMRQQIIITLLTHMAATFKSLFSAEKLREQGLQTGIGCRYCGAQLDGNDTSQVKVLCECNITYYCNAEHKAQDLVYHESTCKALRKYSQENQNKDL